jgi:UPF0716 protein FxsA
VVLRLIFQIAVFGLVDLTLLLVLGNYTSWKVALVEVLASAVLGVVVIRYVTGRDVFSRLAVRESPSAALGHGVLLFVAGILLILPGIISDVVGLLLLIPLVRRLLMAWLGRRLLAHSVAIRPRFDHSGLSDDPRTAGVIIESHVVDHDPSKDD